MKKLLLILFFSSNVFGANPNDNNSNLFNINIEKIAGTYLSACFAGEAIKNSSCPDLKLNSCMDELKKVIPNHLKNSLFSQIENLDEKTKKGMGDSIVTGLINSADKACNNYQHYLNNWKLTQLNKIKNISDKQAWKQISQTAFYQDAVLSDANKNEILVFVKTNFDKAGPEGEKSILSLLKLDCKSPSSSILAVEFYRKQDLVDYIDMVFAKKESKGPLSANNPINLLRKQKCAL